MSATTTSCRSTSPSCDVTRYLLDTDTLSWLVRDPAGAVARRATAVGEEALATKSIVAGALRFGAAIGPDDLWIAAHALAEECVVVTGNVREFRRVVGLGVEDWREG